MPNAIAWTMYQCDACGSQMARPTGIHTPDHHVPSGLPCGMFCAGEMVHFATVNTASKILWELQTIATGQWLTF